MADKTFVGRAFPPRADYIDSEVSFNLDDLALLTQWAGANDGRITVRVGRGKSGKPYAEINTWKKNAPGQSPQSAHRYAEEDRPEPAECQSQPEADAAFDDQIPF